MSNANQVIIENDTLSIRFDRFDSETYPLFLRAKRIPEYTVLLDEGGLACGIQAPARFAGLRGVAAPELPASDLPINEAAFDDQAAIVRMALAAKRFADWADCGLGKSLVMWEWARQ